MAQLNNQQISQSFVGDMHGQRPVNKAGCNWKVSPGFPVEITEDAFYDRFNEITKPQTMVINKYGYVLTPIRDDNNAVVALSVIYRYDHTFYLSLLTVS